MFTLPENYKTPYIKGVIAGPFIADYVVWALLIVKGRTVTYSC